MVFSMPIPPKPPWHSTPTAIVPLPTVVPISCNSLIESPTDTCQKKPYDNIENNNDRPDDDDDDVDCFPRQDKQPVLPQDISPTAPTTADANNTSPSLIETPTAPMNTDNNNNNNLRRTTPTRTKQSAYRGSKTKPTHTAVPNAPLLVWDGTQYQLDYTHNHRRPIYTWNGTTHTDIVYDDDYDCHTDYDYADGDSLNMNDPSVRLQFTQCLKTVQFNNYLQAAHHIDTATTNDTPHANQSKHTTTTMKETQNDPPPTYTYDTLRLSFLPTHYETTSNDYYTEEFPLYTVPQYIPRKQHPGHDNYLYRRWNNPTASHKHKTKKTRTKHQRLLVTTKDDASVTPTLDTLSTTDTSTPHQHSDADMLISIMIWNKPIVQYRMPNQLTRHRSRYSSTAVRYALIGVYDKLNPSKLPCLLLFFASIIYVALSCSILLADSFTMVKIDDRYPDEWND